MLRKTFILSTVVLGIAFSGLAHAESATGARGNRMDKNQDGVVDSQEYQHAESKKFDRMDLNKDGVVSKEEIQKMREERAKKSAHRQSMMIKKLDKNSDGSLTKGEYDSASKSRFDSLDTNKDGKISAEERHAGTKTSKKVTKPASVE